MDELQYEIDLYEQEGKSTYEIAEEIGTYPNKIRRILKKHGISLKSRSEAQKNALEGGRAKHPTGGKKRTKSERIKISQHTTIIDDTKLYFGSGEDWSIEYDIDTANK